MVVQAPVVMGCRFYFERGAYAVGLDMVTKGVDIETIVHASTPVQPVVFCFVKHFAFVDISEVDHRYQWFECIVRVDQERFSRRWSGYGCIR